MSSLQSSALPKVFLSPFVLSTVMLDNSNILDDQEGFLIGKSYKSVRLEINDQSMCSAEEDLMISVYSAYPVGNYLSFYDQQGAIDISKIQNFLGDRIQSVVGWYRHRRNAPTFPSIREAIVHSNLMSIFSGNLAIGDNYFVYGVFGSSAAENLATHTYDYAFFIEGSDKFRSLGMSILNLVDTKTKYRSGSLASSYVNSQSFDSALNIQWNFESCWQTEDGIQQMHQVLRDKCSNLAEELTVSESVNATIEDDISKLEDELRLLTAIDMSEQAVEEVCKEIVENIPPKDESSSKPLKKRYWSEVVDFEEEKQHPVYGTYFEQNRADDQENISLPSDNYSIIQPQKKVKILQDNKRVIDHDYSSASDEDSHKYIQEMEEDKAEDLDGISLPSETEDCEPGDGVVSEEVIVYTETILHKEENMDDLCFVDKAEEVVVQLEEDDSSQIRSPDSKEDSEDLNTGSGSGSTNSGRPFIVYCKSVDTQEKPTDKN